MNRDHEDTCSLCLSYILSHLTSEELERFEKHLPGCEKCRNEIAELLPVVSSIAFAADPAPVPDGLKQRTLEAAFKAKAPAMNGISVRKHAPFPSAGIASWQSFAANRYGKLAITLVAGMAIALGISIWQLNQYREQIQAMLNPAAPTSKVERTYILYAAGDQPNASGVAYLAETSQGVQLVIQVHNASPLTGQQAYQVWLLKNGQRENAGTFRVNEKGEGVLVYSAGSKRPDFDNIGITLEPDEKGTFPRGPKVLGTKL